jgi:hypothetical protein
MSDPDPSAPPATPESKSRRAFNALGTFLGHNFVLFVLGLICAIAVVPRLTDRVNRGGAIQQRRVEVSLQILRVGYEVERRLAQLQVRLTSFRTDVWKRKLSMRELRSEQARLRSDALSDYLEFNRAGWGWIYQTVSQSKELDIATPEESAG